MNIQKLFERQRENKYSQFIEKLKPKRTDKILDIGVENKEYRPTSNFFEKRYPYLENITAIGIGELSEFSKLYPKVKTIVYDGRHVPFPDKLFDISYSNAVIEHVGTWEQQKYFIREIKRVSRKVMITTPNKHFPIDLHTNIPLLHWLPKKTFDKLLMQMKTKSWAAGDYMNLLSNGKLKRLLSDSGIKRYEIIKNNFCGLTCTFSVFWEQ